MTTRFIVNGEEKELVMRDKHGIDWSGDFIGNTDHGMGYDEEGRYIATPEEFEWWEDMIAKWEKMEGVIAEYKERFGSDQVDEVVGDAMGGWDLEDQPFRAIEGLEEVFGKL